MKVSVIIPVYNTAKYLPFLFCSLENQTFKDFEVIFVNDGSTDNSLKLLESFKKSSCLDVKVISQENMGLPGARNSGIDVAAGDYITFIDSDDNVELFYIEGLLDGMEQGKLDFSCILYRKNKKHKFYKRKSRCGKLKKIVFESCVSYGDFIRQIHDCRKAKKLKYFIFPNFVWGKLYKRELIGQLRFQMDMTGAEDVMFNAIYFTKVRNAGFVCECAYDYLQHSGSILHAKSKDKISRNLSASLRASEVALDVEKDKDSENYDMLCVYSFIDKLTLLTLLDKTQFVETLKSYKSFLVRNYGVFKRFKKRKWYYCFVNVLYKFYEKRYFRKLP